MLQISKKLQSKKLVGSLSSLHEHSVRVKTPMGLEPFEVSFFVRVKFTKVDLALNVVIRNYPNLGSR